MIIESHLDKLRRLCRLRERFDPLEDFELWYWTTLTAGTNALNAVLHDAGLTAPDPVFSTIPGVHLVRQPDGRYARELRGPGDVSHVGWPPIEGDIPADVGELIDALHGLETYRDPCVRGTHVIDAAVVNACETAFSRVLQAARGRFEGRLR